MTSIGSDAFRGDTLVYLKYNCQADLPRKISPINRLSTLIIGDSVTSIGLEAFRNCTSLSFVTIPNSVTYIDIGAFYGCTGLTSITIPNSVSQIGMSAFASCSLDSLTIGNGLNTIGSNAFGRDTLVYLNYNCPANITDAITKDRLSTVVIGEQITSIVGNAFRYCSSIDTIYLLPNTPPLLENPYVFDGNSTNRVFIVGDCSSYDNYYTTDPNNYWYNYRDALRNPSNDIVFTVMPNDTLSEQGYVTASTVKCDSTVTIQAYPNDGYIFDHWSNGSTTNPDTIHLTGDSTVTAFFLARSIINLFPNDSTCDGKGTTSYSQINEHQVRIDATPSYGYHFAMWSDGDTSNPRIITLTHDTTFTAIFVPNEYTLTFLSGDNNMGIVNIVSISGIYLDTSQNIFATALPHYHFTHWSDGTTENPRRFVFLGDQTYSALFAIDTHTVIVQLDDIVHGSVTGGGSFEYGTPATVSASSYSGFHFTHWSNGATYNPYTFAVVEDKNLTAFFVADGESWQDTVIVYDTTYFLLHDTTVINNYIHDTTIVDNWIYDTTYLWQYDTTVINNYIHDTTIVDNWIYDTTYLWQYDTTVVTLFDTTMIHDTIIITESLTYHNLSVITNNPVLGIVAGSGQFPEGTQVEIAAIPMEGCNFVSWSDGSTENPHTVILNENAYYIATFSQSSQGTNSPIQSKWYAYSESGTIVVMGDNLGEIQILDELGRLLHSYSSPANVVRFIVPSSGIYFVRVDNSGAKRIVVIR